MDSETEYLEGALELLVIEFYFEVECLMENYSFLLRCFENYGLF